MSDGSRAAAAVERCWARASRRWVRYYTTETYRDEHGRQQTRRVRHVRWRPAAGEVRHFFDDEPVPGTQGIPARLLVAVMLLVVWLILMGAD